MPALVRSAFVRLLSRARCGRPCIAAIGVAALMLLTGCVQGYNPDAYAGWTLRRAQDACDAGDAGACAAANDLRMQDIYSL